MKRKRPAAIEVGTFRRALALYLMWYYSLFASDLMYVFGASGMVDRTVLTPVYPSLLLGYASPIVYWTAYVLIFVFSIALFRGKLSRVGALTLFVLNLSFHNANPLIIHEPQQLASLFLLLFVVFLPPKAHATVDRRIVTTMVFALGAYYFAAGLKKLPDPAWLDGTAVSRLLMWDGLGRANALTSLITSSHAASALLSWSTLAFELSFLPLVFTRFRGWLLLCGVGFHIAIAATMEVGTFPWIMLAWYGLVIDLDRTVEGSSRG